MNFNIVDGKYADLDSIYNDFVEDYVFSTELKNNEIRVKYGLTHKEFKELSDMVKADYGLSRRPIKITGAKYYYEHKHGFHIQKTVDNVINYIGFVPTEDLAIEVVEKCKNASWDVDVCRNILRECVGYAI